MPKNKRKSRSKAKPKQKREIQRIIEYFVSGGAWFWSGYILIVLLDSPLGEIFGAEVGLFIANAIGNGVGLTINFLLERYWVFKTNRPAKLGIAVKRYIVYTFLNAFILNYLILEGLRYYFGLGPEIGQFIASGFFTVWNYFWYKYYVFKGVDHQHHRKRRRTRHHA